MEKRIADLLAQVADYYAAKLAEHGETPRGVDWNSEDSQVLRFEQLSKVINHRGNFSINDLGCGYGALLDYLNSRYLGFVYNGYDIAMDMVRAAEKRYAGNGYASFRVAAEPQEIADYGIASGIFNVRLNHSDLEWRRYLEASLDILAQTSQKGFAFNCLTIYSDAEKMRGHLYYADPCELFDLCKRRYSRHVAVLHDYDLYEFTIVVKKIL